MGLKSVNDVARMFNYERSTIIRYVKDGHLEAIGGGAKGKPYYISDEAIEKFKTYLEQQCSSDNWRRRPHKKKADKVSEPHPLYDTARIMKRIIRHNGISVLDVVKKMGTGGYSYKMKVFNGEQSVSREFSKVFCDIFDIEPKDLDTLIASQQYIDVEIRPHYEESFAVVSYLGPANEESNKSDDAIPSLGEYGGPYYISINAKMTGNTEFINDGVLTPLKIYMKFSDAFRFINENILSIFQHVFKFDEAIKPSIVKHSNNIVVWRYIECDELKVYEIEFNVKKIEVV